MASTRVLLGTAAHVGEHVAALFCFSTFEVASHAFVGAFGLSPQGWPDPVLIAAGAVIYVAGLATTRLIGRRWRRWRSRAIEVPRLLPRSSWVKSGHLFGAAAVFLLGGAAALLLARRRGGKDSEAGS